jgi:hypothetical protein
MNKRGITIIELVIVVIILILLSILSIWIGMNSDVFNKAEAATAFSEMKAVYTGVIHIRDRYNIGTIDSYEKGRDYCEVAKESGEYYIYGLDASNLSSINIKDTSGNVMNLYNEEVVKNLGISELKRSYKVSFDKGTVELVNPLVIGAYEVKSYEDMISIQESGVI